MSATVSPPVGKSRRRRWRPQFGLRTLLVACISLGGLCGVIAKVEHDARRQREVTAMVERIGGRWFSEPKWEASWWTDVVRERLGDEYVDAIYQIDFNPGEVYDEQVVNVLKNTDLTYLTLRDVPATNAVMPAVASQRHLESLDLIGTQIDDDGLVYLRNSSQLTEVNLAGSPITDAGLRHLASLPALESLILSLDPITDQGITTIRRMESLKSLYLNETRITAAAIKALRGHPRLFLLCCSDTQFTGDDLAGLADLPSLRKLQIHRTPLCDDDVPHLVRASQIDNLYIFDTRLTDLGLSRFAALRPNTNLTLFLGGESISDAGLLAIRMIPHLTELTLTEGKFTDHGVELLAACPSLEVLRLENDGFTDRCLEYVARFRHLREFSISSANVTADAIRALRASSPNCTILGASY